MTDDQKNSQSQPFHLEWQPHTWQHHSHSWSLDRTKDQGQETVSNPPPLFGWPHNRHDHVFHKRRHHWPRWSRWHHGQNTDQDSKDKETQLMHPQTNDEQPIKVHEFVVNDKKDNIEELTLGEAEKLNESSQNNEDQKTNEGQRMSEREKKGLSEDCTTKENRQTNEDLETKEIHQFIKTKEDQPSTAEIDKSVDAKDNLELHLLTKCQTINAEGKKIRLHNAFCFWPEMTETNSTVVESTVGTTTVCEERAIIPDVLMPDDEYVSSNQFKNRIECRQIEPDQENKGLYEYKVLLIYFLTQFVKFFRYFSIQHQDLCFLAFYNLLKSSNGPKNGI